MLQQNKKYKDESENEKQYRALISEYNKEIKWHCKEIRMCDNLKERSLNSLERVKQNLQKVKEKIWRKR